MATSLLLAIPTLIGASVLSAWKVRADLAAHWHEYLPLFAVGFVVSFLAAWVCVRWLLRYIATHTFDINVVVTGRRMKIAERFMTPPSGRRVARLDPSR